MNECKTLDDTGPWLTVRMIRMKHREPALRWFGTHLYISMQMLVRHVVEDDVPEVSDQQVRLRHFRAFTETHSELAPPRVI